MDETLSEQRFIRQINMLGMVDGNDISRKAFARFLETHRISARALSKAANMSPSAASQFLQGNARSPRADTLLKFAEGASKLLGRHVSIFELLGNEAGQQNILDFGGHNPPAAPSPDQAAPSPPPAVPVIPLQPPVGRADIPVWSAVAAGDEQGTMLMTDTPIDWIMRSDRMMGVANPFAFYIVGDSMEHRFMQGDMAVVNPSMPMRSGSDCVFISQGEDGQLYGLVKRLVRASPDAWKVRQLNPVKDFELSRRRWSRAYPIIETRHRA